MAIIAGAWCGSGVRGVVEAGGGGGGAATCACRAPRLKTGEELVAGPMLPSNIELWRRADRSPYG